MIEEQSTTEISLSSWQDQVWNDISRYLVINCGRRSGKSTLASLKMLHFATENSNSIVWYVAPNYKQAKAIMWQMLLELIPKKIIKKKNETELKIVLTNNSQILLKGAEDPDTLRGVRIDLSVFDEVAFFDKWDEVWKVMRPTLADSKAKVWFISTPNGMNHFKELSENDGDGWKYFHFTTYDNPHIPKSELELMRDEMDEDSFAQEIMGEFRKMSGLIYKAFNRTTHMIDIPNITGWTIHRSLDFGYAHKSALGYFAINPIGTEIVMFDGLYEVGLTSQDLASAIKIKDSGKYVASAVADSAQPMNIEELSREGVNFQPIEKGPDSVKNGIMKVAELLKIRKDTGKPTLMFAKHLSWAAEEFEKYRWMQSKSGQTAGIKEVPLKKDDDAMDMIRYFAMNYKQDTSDLINTIVLKNQKVKNKWKLR